MQPKAISLSTQEYPNEICLSRGIPGADTKSERLNLILRTQKANPSRCWAFEIDGSTALHEIIENAHNNIIVPNQIWWVQRIVREGGEKVVNWSRSKDRASPLHLAKSTAVVEILLNAGANPNLQNNSKQIPLQKIVCSPFLKLEKRASIYHLFLKYGPPPQDWKLGHQEQDLFDRVVSLVEAEKRKWSLLLLNFVEAEWDTPFAWLPKELHDYIILTGFFLPLNVDYSSYSPSGKADEEHI